MDGPFAGEEEDAKPLDVGTSEVVAVVRGAVKLDLGDLQVILDEHKLDRVGEEAQVSMQVGLVELEVANGSSSEEDDFLLVEPAVVTLGHPVCTHKCSPAGRR